MDKETEGQALQSKSLLSTSRKEDTSELNEQLEARKKNSYLKIGLILGGTALVVLIVVLAIVLTKSDGNKPIAEPSYYNPYKISKVDNTNPRRVTGLIDVDKKALSEQFNPSVHMQKFLTAKFGEAKLKKKVDVKAIPTGENNKMADQLAFTFSMLEWRTAHLQITDSKTPRYQIPDEVLNIRPQDNVDQPDHPNMRMEMVGFKMSPSQDTFAFSFNDPLITEGDNSFISTNNCSLVFMDKFIMMEFNLPSQRVFGLGERAHGFQLEEGVWNMWSRSATPFVDDGTTGRKGLSGVHPFMLIQGRRKDDFIGLYFKNSDFMSPILTYNADGTSKLTFITLGGMLDVLFFVHGSVSTIVKNYRSFVAGRPSLPPFWALGWQQGSELWVTHQDIQSSIDAYQAAGLPLDSIRLEQKFIENINEPVTFKSTNPIHIVAEMSPGIPADPKDDIFREAMDKNVLIKSTMELSETYDDTLINFDSNNDLYSFISWLHEDALTIWGKKLDALFKQVAYEGLAFFLNEPFTVCDGEVGHASQKCLDVQGPAPSNSRRQLLEATSGDTTWYQSNPDQSKESTYNLPFIPSPKEFGPLDTFTLSLNATDLSLRRQFDTHSLYGAMMVNKTAQYHDKINKDKDSTDPRKDKRQFIMSHSTFTRSGKFTSHHIGQNQRTYEHMQLSIPSIMSMNLFGVPHSGPDVCGYYDYQQSDKIDQKLCARWVQLATYYPLAVFSVSSASLDNQPYLITDEPYKTMIRRSMHDRYQYLRLLYTCLYEGWQGDPPTGVTCFDPLFYHFPNDDAAYENMDTSFIYANALLVSPVLNDLPAEAQTLNQYFPASSGAWVSMLDTSLIRKAGQKSALDAGTPSAQVHLMPGRVLPKQSNSGERYKSTSQLVNSAIQLVVNPDGHGYAEGSLFLDQGALVSELNDKLFEYYRFQFSKQSLQVQYQDGKRGSQDKYTFESLTIVNPAILGKDLSKVDEEATACFLNQTDNLKPVKMSVNYDATSNTINMYTSKVDSVPFSQVHSVYLTWKGEFSPCTDANFQYAVVGDAPKFDKETETIQLHPTASGLPDLEMSLQLIQNNKEDTDGILNVKWTWGAAAQKPKRFEVPKEFIDMSTRKANGVLSDYVSITPDQPFNLKFRYDPKAKTEFFGVDGLAFDDYLNWANTHVVTTETGDKFRGIFGLGQRANKDFFYRTGVYSIYSRSKPGAEESGDLPGNNWYGAQPFYMFKHAPGRWVGVFYNLAAAQDWWIHNNDATGVVDLKTIAVGGVMDIYLIRGAKPEDVIAKYYTIIGKPVLVPQWILGWNQCRYSYKSLQELKDVVNGYKQGNFPLDVMWSDVDYMKNYRNFQYDDEQAYIGLPAFVDELHASGMRYIPILDAATAARPRPEDKYQPYLDALEAKAMMTLGGKPFVGMVWPNDAAFPDFMPGGTGGKWWTDELDKFHQVLPFDGLWLDMNEAENFCAGICYPNQAIADPMKPKLSYVPTGRDLEVASLPLKAQHASGDIALDTHSLYAISEHKVTHEWFQNNLKQRTMIITRSHFAGSGKWASTWLGDNVANVNQMQLSVFGVMMSNIFGMPVAGSDICGFIDNTTKELCIRWHFVGAFYPFSRNHNNWWERPQEPYVWDKDTQDLLRQAIRIKYSLIRYYYTQLFEMHLEGRSTLYKPLFFEFPDDPLASQLADTINKNIMLGSALKLSINPTSIETKGVLTTEYYFPMGSSWCLLSGTPAAGDTDNCFNAGQDSGLFKSFPSALSDYQLHLRDGYIVPYQNTLGTQIVFSTSKVLQQYPVEFHVHGQMQVGDMDGQWRALGRYANDDGVDINLDQTFNAYSIFAGSLDKDQKQLFLQVAQMVNQVARNKKMPDTPEGCYAVNNNDFVSKFTFHNAKRLGIDKDYKVTAFMLPDLDKGVPVKGAVYDKATDRLVLDFGMVPKTEALCLTMINHFIFDVVTPSQQ